MPVIPTAIRLLMPVCLLFIAFCCDTKPSPKKKTNANLPFSATLSWRAKSPGRGNQQDMDLELSEIPEEKGYRVGMYRVLRMGKALLFNRMYDSATVANEDGRYVLSVNSADTLALLFDDFLSFKALPKSLIRFTTEPGAPGTKRAFFAAGNVIVKVDEMAKAPALIETPKQKPETRAGLFQIIDDVHSDSAAITCYEGGGQVNDGNNPVLTLAALQRLTLRGQDAPVLMAGGFPKYQWSYPELLFDFTDMNLDEAMKQLAGWYGIKNVVFDPKIDRKKRGTVLIGKLSRYLLLEQVLQILDRDGQHFRKQGQSIVVTKNL